MKSGMPTRTRPTEEVEAAMSLTTRLFAFLLAVVFAGCQNEPRRNLDSVESLTLYSIDGTEASMGQESAAGETFRGYPLLGQIDITASQSRQEIADAINSSISQSDGLVAACFWPRHALRVRAQGQTIDYVVCFQCRQLEVYEGKSRTMIPIETTAEPVLNRWLEQAGIPLAR